MRKPKREAPGARGARGLAAQLARAVEASALSPHALAQKAGIDPRSLGRFLAGERGLTFDSAGALAEALGLSLVDARKGKKGAAGE